MVTQIVRLVCPSCLRQVLVLVKPGEPYLCPSCLHFSHAAASHRVPSWVWGALLTLAAGLLLAR